jgi:hypothetical protein
VSPVVVKLMLPSPPVVTMIEPLAGVYCRAK